MPSRITSRSAYARARWTLAVTTAICLTAAYGGGCEGSSGSRGGASASVSSPVARGRLLYRVDGCDGCHSLDGARVVGPSWRGLAGSKVVLADGRGVIADRAYLIRHIVEPDATTVRGYPAGVMAQAIEALDLAHKPRDVRALVAFIESLANGRGHG